MLIYKKFSLVFVCFLCLPVFSTSQTEKGGNHKLPSFMWMEGHLSEQGVPFLNIRFPDQKWDDFVVFETQISPDSSTNCILRGHLFHERNVTVKLTRGCPPSKSFEIFFDSSRLSLASFKVTKGKVKPIIQNLPGGKYTELAAASNLFSGDNLVEFPDEGFVLKVKAFYDQSFKRRFDVASEFIVQKIVEKSQDIFMWPTLTTFVKLELQQVEEIPTTIFSSLDNLYEVADNYTANISVNAFVFFSDEHFDDVGSEESQGIAFIKKICSSDHKDRVAIVEWTDSLSVTSSTLAHELGHLLGMEHDFIHDKKTKTKFVRRDRNTKKCSAVGGVMDYTDNRTRWSTCSVEDFLGYYSQVIQEDTNGMFCLMQNPTVLIETTPSYQSASIPTMSLNFAPVFKVSSVPKLRSLLTGSDSNNLGLSPAHIEDSLMTFYATYTFLTPQEGVTEVKVNGEILQLHEVSSKFSWTFFGPMSYYTIMLLEAKQTSSNLLYYEVNVPIPKTFTSQRTKPVCTYTSPSPSGPGIHNFVFLFIRQSKVQSVISKSCKRSNFNINSYFTDATTSGGTIGKVVAANYFSIVGSVSLL